MKREHNLKVYYDGLCVLCSREIEHYRKQQGAEHIEFIDICGPSFQPDQEGVDPFLVHRLLHAKKPDGTIVTRLDAFIEIWQRLPRYHFLSRLAKRPFVKAVFEMAYTLFASMRPYLPRRKAVADCANSPYCMRPAESDKPQRGHPHKATEKEIYAD